MLTNSVKKMKKKTMFAMFAAGVLVGYALTPLVNKGYDKVQEIVNPEYVCTVSGYRADYYPVNYRLTVSPEVVKGIKNDSYFDGMKVAFAGYQTEEEKMFYVQPTDDTTLNYSVSCIKN